MCIPKIDYIDDLTNTIISSLDKQFSKRILKPFYLIFYLVLKSFLIEHKRMHKYDYSLIKRTKMIKHIIQYNII